MKKIYLFTAIAFSTISFTFLLNAQEMIAGGDMENADAWKISKLNQDTDNTVEYTFGYTDVIPTSGAGGCLYVSGTNTGAENGQLTNFMFYQQITLKRGVTYVFDGAYKDVRTNNFWTEVYWGGNEPAEGSDYGTDQGAVFISGFKSTNWESECPSDAFDGTFQSDACTPGTTNTIMIEGEGDTTIFFGFRMGIWDNESNGYTFEVYIDNISLIGPNVSAIDEQSLKISLFPNPIQSKFTVTIEQIIQEVEVSNLLGQTIYKAENIGSKNYTLDISDANNGVYYIKITDINGNKGVTKTLKLKR